MFTHYLAQVNRASNPELAELIESCNLYSLTVPRNMLTYLLYDHVERHIKRKLHKTERAEPIVTIGRRSTSFKKMSPQHYTQAGLPNSCAIHSVMVFFDVLDIHYPGFNFTEKKDVLKFIATFDKMNNFQLCTPMSHISDVLRSFCDLICPCLMKNILHAYIIRRPGFSFNLCEIQNVDEHIDRGSDVNNIIKREDFAASVRAPYYLIFDQLTYTTLFKDLNNRIPTTTHTNQDAFKIQIYGTTYYLIAVILEIHGGHFGTVVFHMDREYDLPVPKKIPYSLYDDAFKGIQNGEAMISNSEIIFDRKDLNILAAGAYLYGRR